MVHESPRKGQEHLDDLKLDFGYLESGGKAVGTCRLSQRPGVSSLLAQFMV